jgi:hypothetical protein
MHTGCSCLACVEHVCKAKIYVEHTQTEPNQTTGTAALTGPSRRKYGSIARVSANEEQVAAISSNLHWHVFVLQICLWGTARNNYRFQLKLFPTKGIVHKATS